MPTPKPDKLSPAKLRKAFHEDLAAAWNHARKRHPNDTPYAFVLWGVEGGNAQLWPNVLTEEGLTQVAERYVTEGVYDTLEESREALRYSVADSPRLEELENHLPNVDAVFGPHAGKLGETQGYAMLAKAAMEALAALDAEGLFGVGAERDRIVLVILTEDTEKDWTEKSAKRLNPPNTFACFNSHNKTDGLSIASDLLATSPDGRSVYSAGNRQVSDKSDRTVSEVVAYDLRDSRLSRRWAFTFPSFGDSIDTLACMPDGRTVLAGRCTYINHKPVSRFLRFDADSNEPVLMSLPNSDFSPFVLSPDGSLAAGWSNKSTLLVMETTGLKIVNQCVVDSGPGDLAFLRSGDLLIASNQGVLRIDRDMKAHPTPAREKRAVIAVDGDNQHLLTYCLPANWEEREKGKELGFHLYALPSYDLIRTQIIPHCQINVAVISPDGQFVAIETHEIGTHRKRIVLFATNDGRQVASRKSPGVNDLLFSPDSRMLLIAKRAWGFEPIECWDFLAASATV